MARTCGGCGATIEASTARWCGSCGARLADPATRGPAVPVAGAVTDGPGGAPEPAGAGGTAGSAGAVATRLRPTDAALVHPPAPALVIPDDPDEELAPASRWPLPARIATVAAVGLAVLGGLLLRPDPAPTFEPRGYTARGDAARSGVVSLAPLEAPREVAWEVDTDAGEPVGTVAGGGDVVVETVGLRTLAVRDAATGGVRWIRRDTPVGAVAVGGEVAAVATGTSVEAFDLATGARRWSLPATAGEEPRTLPDGDLLLVDGRSDTLRRVDNTTGELRWAVDLAGDVGVSIAAVRASVTGLALWATSPPGLAPDSPRVRQHAVLLDVETGALRWVRDGVSVAPGYTDDPVVATRDGAAVLTDRTGASLLDRSGRVVGTVDLGAFPTQLTASDTELVAHLPVAGVVGFDLGTGARRWERPDLDDTRTLVAGSTTVLATGIGRSTLLDARSGATILELEGEPAPAGLGRLAEGAIATVVDAGIVVADPATGVDPPVAALPDPLDAPAVAHDRVYLGTATGVAVLDAGDGEPVWTYDELAVTVAPGSGSRQPSRTPAVAGTTVLVSPAGGLFGSGPGLVALERTGGIRAWDREGDTPTVRGPLTLVGDTAFVPVGDEVHGYDTVNGRRAFAAVADALLGPLVVSPNRVIGATSWEPGGTHLPGVVAILRRDRSLTWRAEVDACSAPALAGDAVVVGTPDGVVALDETTGQPRWELATALPVCLDPVVADATVVVVDEAVGLRAVVAATGRTRWTATLPSPVVAAPVVAGDTLLAPLLDGTLVGLDVADGTTRWTVDLGAPATSSPVVADGRVIVRLRGGRLVALAS